MNKSNTIKLVCAAMGTMCSIGTAAVPAQAEPIRFSYSANELRTGEGIAALHDRIERVVARGCRPIFSVQSLGGVRSCRDRAKGQLIAEINNMMLSSYAERSGNGLKEATR